MSRSFRRVALPSAALVVLLPLTACSSGGATAAPTVDSTQSQLQDQLDVLPGVDGARRTADTFRGATLTESYTVPEGSPACLQVLARLDASGYDVVAGKDQAAVDPTTCGTAAGDPTVTTAAGTATILARGGSEIALTWTATTYSVTVSAS